MAAVLVLVGTGKLSALEWIVGLVGGSVAFLAVLLVTKELTVSENRFLSSSPARALGAAERSTTLTGLTSPRTSLRNDIAIYPPFAFSFYEDPSSKAYQDAKGGGGAELQRPGWRGFSRAMACGSPSTSSTRSRSSRHICAVARGRPTTSAGRSAGRAGQAGGTLGVWRALVAADARLYVFGPASAGASLPSSSARCFVHSPSAPDPGRLERSRLHLRAR